MASLADNFLSDPLLRQPLIRAKRENSNNKLVAAVTIGPSKLNVSSFAVVVVLRLVKSKAH